MADIFVSYATEDRDRIRPLVERLEREGWSVWWDRELVAGPRFDEKIEQELDTARCVLVAWSNHSIGSRWCRSEANEGLERNILVPLRIDEVRPPLAFRSSHTASLAGWPEHEGDLVAVLAGVRDCLGVPPQTRVEPDPDAKSIAVLPFTNMSADPDQEYFADGMTEDLIDRLARQSSIRVIARTSSFYYKNRSDDVREIGSRLGVTHVVEGSVRRSGTRLRITVQLINANNGGHEWSDRYDRELDDIFVLQDEIADTVARQLTARLVASSRGHQPKIGAYEEYLKGQSWLRRFSYRGAVRAQTFFDAAIRLDPNYPEPYLAAADAALWQRAFSPDSEMEALECARAYVDKALALVGETPDVLLVKARLTWIEHFDLQGALDEIRRAIDEYSDAGNREDFSRVGEAYEPTGRWDLTEDWFARSFEHDPLNITVLGGLAFCAMARTRLDEAQRWLSTILAIDPDHALSKGNTVVLLVLQGQFNDALSYIEKHRLENYPLACFGYAANGRADQIERIIDRVGKRSGWRSWLAQAYALLGDLDGVLRSAHEAIETRDLAIANLATGPFHHCIDVHGRKLAEMYDRLEVQQVLARVGLDKQSLSRLRI